MGRVFRVPYEQRAQDAQAWAREHNLSPASADNQKITLLLVDVQNTFCIPGYELFVGGVSGTGAVDDNRRLVEFLYRNLNRISRINLTLDTHSAMQIFHSLFLVDADGRHPDPYTLVSTADIAKGRWRFNPAVADNLPLQAGYGQEYLEHYVERLQAKEKFQLTIWPYHAMLGGIGHALVSAVEEAVFFHTVARMSQPEFAVKGDNPLTEHYSAVGPEVVADQQGRQIGVRQKKFLRMVIESDAVVIAGQAKSHCVAWTVADILADIQAEDPGLAQKVYLLDDCSSPVVVPGGIDYSGEAEAAYTRFAAAGMHLVRSSQPMASWPGFPV